MQEKGINKGGSSWKTMRWGLLCYQYYKFITGDTYSSQKSQSKSPSLKVKGISKWLLQTIPATLTPYKNHKVKLAWVSHFMSPCLTNCHPKVPYNSRILSIIYSSYLWNTFWHLNRKSVRIYIITNHHSWSIQEIYCYQSIPIISDKSKETDISCP